MRAANHSGMDHPAVRQHLTPAEIEEIKSAHPIEQVAASYAVALKRVGVRLVGLCPLHEEVHPSFTVFPDAQRFYCFGCRQGGDVIELVQRLERVGFLEAVACLQGPPVHAHGNARIRQQPAKPPHTALAEQALQARTSPVGQAALEIASWVYHQALLASPAAQAYLARRGIGYEVATRGRLGYCASTQLVPALQRQGVPLVVARALGLLAGRDGHERFTGRITIPELRGGKAVWLTGRLLDESADAPRYMSLPGPRPLLGAELIAGRPAVIGVEGSFDWLTLVGWGMPGFAALGGSLAHEAPTLLQPARTIYLAFDRDATGQHAAHILAARLGERARLVTLPDGVKDINELGQRPDGAEQFRACVLRAAREQPHPLTTEAGAERDREAA